MRVPDWRVVTLQFFDLLATWTFACVGFQPNATFSALSHLHRRIQHSQARRFAEPGKTNSWCRCLNKSEKFAWIVLRVNALCLHPTSITIDKTSNASPKWNTLPIDFSIQVFVRELTHVRCTRGNLATPTICQCGAKRSERRSRTDTCHAITGDLWYPETARTFKLLTRRSCAQFTPAAHGVRRKQNDRARNGLRNEVPNWL